MDFETVNGTIKSINDDPGVWIGMVSNSDNLFVTLLCGKSRVGLLMTADRYD